MVAGEESLGEFLSLLLVAGGNYLEQEEMACAAGVEYPPVE